MIDARVVYRGVVFSGVCLIVGTAAEVPLLIAAAYAIPLAAAADAMVGVEWL